MSEVINDTIIALATPRGPGALAVLRLSGHEAISITALMGRLPKNKNLLEVLSNTIHFGWVVDKTGMKIDQVMFSVLRAPRTFTGEDVVEITCHNNQFIIEALIEEAIAHGARLARQGEFTERAFLNGKLDLAQAEALNDLIHAQTQIALKKSLSQLEGTLSSWICDLEQELLRALAWCEASFEFLDEELEFGSQIKEHLEKLLERIRSNKGSYDLHRHIREGVRVVLVGSVNAGKSSLFNMLLEQKRAIVTPVAGTTRDTIEASFTLHGTPITLIDTAGIRTTSDVIEQEGIKRSLEQAHTADIVLLVFDGSRALTGEEEVFYKQLATAYGNKTILIHNKKDLPEHASLQAHTQEKQIFKVSCLSNNHSVNLLKHEISKKLAALVERQETPFLLNERQYRILVEVEHKLALLISNFLGTSTIAYELVSFYLREALECLTGLTGKSVSQEALDRVFKEFCVGK